MVGIGRVSLLSSLDAYSTNNNPLIDHDKIVSVLKQSSVKFDESVDYKEELL